jgi:hypothetical protein
MIVREISKEVFKIEYIIRGKDAYYDRNNQIEKGQAAKDIGDGDQSLSESG